jgi:hypothetical protein
MTKPARPAGIGPSAAALVSAAEEVSSRRSGQSLPEGVQLRVDVHLCLLDAMTDAFPIRREDIEGKTVPSDAPIGADAQGWGVCLAKFSEYIRHLRPIYSFYVHKPKYTTDTLSLSVTETIGYLKARLLGQFDGSE